MHAQPADACRGSSNVPIEGPACILDDRIPEDDSDTPRPTMQHSKSIKRSTSVGYAGSGKGKQKDRKQSERRNRRGTRNQDATSREDAEGVPKAPRLPKRQCALLIGFCGSGYSGMQMFAGPD